MNEIFRDKWALVLGASSGFGAACSRAFAKSGLNIAGVHLDRKATMSGVDQLVQECQSYGVQVKFFNVNAADPEMRLNVVNELKNIAAGKVHIMLHSLAFGALKPFIEENSADELTQKQMDMTLDVMAHSIVYWTQDLRRQALFAQNARIYAMTSAGSSRVWKSYGAVSAAKSALESHCRQLALEMAPHRVCVNAILAGVTDTPALRKIPGNDIMIETAQKRNPMGRLTTPEDIASALVAFSLPNCNFMTGNTIRIDGGENIVD